MRRKGRQELLLMLLVLLMLLLRMRNVLRVGEMLLRSGGEWMVM